MSKFLKVFTSLAFTLALSFSMLFGNNVSFAASDYSKLLTKIADYSTPIDDYTVAQAEQKTIQYLNSLGVNYQIGTQDYITFLTDVSTTNKYEINDDIEKRLITGYASIYLSKLDEQYTSADTNSLYTLSEDIVNKTIKQIREENEAANLEADVKVENMQAVARSVMTTLSTTFSGSLAQSYMNTYWDSRYYNTTFGLMSNDCTNYASQVVWYAGMPMDGTTSSPGYHTSTTTWYNKHLPTGYGYSTAWSTVKDFYGYWVGYKGHTKYSFTTQTSMYTYAKPGDIIQLYHNDTATWYHTIIVNYTSGGDIYYSGHTNDHLHDSLKANVSETNNDYRIIKFNY